jgi:hypothetical protein
MVYNLRPRDVLKRPASLFSSASPAEPEPNKRFRLLPKRQNRYYSGADAILDKEVYRPLCAFELLFTFYPVVQSIIPNLPTPDVLRLSMASPHLRRLLKANGGFYTFSNHRRIVDLYKLTTTLEEMERVEIYEKFARNKDLHKWIADYINPKRITRLVLDGTDVDNFAITLVVLPASNLRLLSMQNCTNIDLTTIKVFLEGLPEGFVRRQLKKKNPPLNDFCTTFLPKLETLRVFPSY